LGWERDSDKMSELLRSKELERMRDRMMVSASSSAKERK
jgi:hypothetical protein